MITPLHRALGIPEGGDIKAAVQAFQTQHGLTADGIAGQKTWAAIWSTLGILPGEPMVHSQPRARHVAYAVQHHSDTTTVAGMVKALNGKKPKSTHFSVDKDGTKTMHLDPAFFVAWHCPGANLSSVGVDVIHRHGESFTAAQSKACGELHRDLARIFGYPAVVQVGRVSKGSLPGQMGADGQLIPSSTVGIYEHGQIQATACPDGFDTAAAVAGVACG